MADADSLTFNALDTFLAEKNHKSTEKGKLFFFFPYWGLAGRFNKQIEKNFKFKKMVFKNENTYLKLKDKN